MELDSKVSKEALLVRVQFCGGFLLLWVFFIFKIISVMQKEICQHKKSMFQDKKIF